MKEDSTELKQSAKICITLLTMTIHDSNNAKVESKNTLQINKPSQPASIDRWTGSKGRNPVIIDGHSTILEVTEKGGSNSVSLNGSEIVLSMTDEKLKHQQGSSPLGLAKSHHSAQENINPKQSLQSQNEVKNAQIGSVDQLAAVEPKPQSTLTKESIDPNAESITERSGFGLDKKITVNRVDSETCINPQEQLSELKQSGLKNSIYQGTIELPDRLSATLKYHTGISIKQKPPKGTVASNKDKLMDNSQDSSGVMAKTIAGVSNSLAPGNVAKIADEEVTGKSKVSSLGILMNQTPRPIPRENSIPQTGASIVSTHPTDVKKVYLHLDSEKTENKGEVRMSAFSGESHLMPKLNHIYPGCVKTQVKEYSDNCEMPAFGSLYSPSYSQAQASNAQGTTTKVSLVGNPPGQNQDRQNRSLGENSIVPSQNNPSVAINNKKPSIQIVVSDPDMVSKRINAPLLNSSQLKPAYSDSSENDYHLKNDYHTPINAYSNTENSNYLSVQRSKAKASNPNDTANYGNSDKFSQAPFPRSPNSANSNTMGADKSEIGFSGVNDQVKRSHNDEKRQNYFSPVSLSCYPAPFTTKPSQENPGRVDYITPTFQSIIEDQEEKSSATKPYSADSGIKQPNETPSANREPIQSTISATYPQNSQQNIKSHQNSNYLQVTHSNMNQSSFGFDPAKEESRQTAYFEPDTTPSSQVTIINQTFQAQESIKKSTTPSVSPITNAPSSNLVEFPLPTTDIAGLGTESMINTTGGQSSIEQSEIFKILRSLLEQNQKSNKVLEKKINTLESWLGKTSSMMRTQTASSKDSPEEYQYKTVTSEEFIPATSHFIKDLPQGSEMAPQSYLNSKKAPQDTLNDQAQQMKRTKVGPLVEGCSSFGQTSFGNQGSTMPVANQAASVNIVNSVNPQILLSKTSIPQQNCMNYPASVSSKYYLSPKSTPNRLESTKKKLINNSADNKSRSFNSPANQNSFTNKLPYVANFISHETSTSSVNKIKTPHSGLRGRRGTAEFFSKMYSMKPTLKDECQYSLVGEKKIQQLEFENQHLKSEVTFLKSAVLDLNKNMMLMETSNQRWHAFQETQQQRTHAYALHSLNAANSVDRKKKQSLPIPSQERAYPTSPPQNRAQNRDWKSELDKLLGAMSRKSKRNSPDQKDSQKDNSVTRTKHNMRVDLTSKLEREDDATVVNVFKDPSLGAVKSISKMNSPISISEITKEGGQGNNEVLDPSKIFFKQINARKGYAGDNGSYKKSSEPLYRSNIETRSLVETAQLDLSTFPANPTKEIQPYMNMSLRSPSFVASNSGAPSAVSVEEYMASVSEQTSGEKDLLNFCSLCLLKSGVVYNDDLITVSLDSMQQTSSTGLSLEIRITSIYCFTLKDVSISKYSKHLFTLVVSGLSAMANPEGNQSIVKLDIIVNQPELALPIKATTKLQDMKGMSLEVCFTLPITSLAFCKSEQLGRLDPQLKKLVYGLPTVTQCFQTAKTWETISKPL
jgi:hypothetical protein